MWNKSLLRIAYDWAVRCFGMEHVNDTKVRSERMLEEVLEFCQAVGIHRQTAYRILNMVYDRPSGEAYQELGGVLLTLAVLCESHGYDPEKFLVSELIRVLNKPPAHFQERNAHKVELIHGEPNANS